MLIGIDESGTFKPDSKSWHFFMAAMLRKGKAAQFAAWEERIDCTGRERGEVKGRLLSTEQLTSFVKDVLLTVPRVRLRPIAVIPGDNPAATVEAHRAGMVAETTAAARGFERVGDLARMRLGEVGAKWARKCTPQDYLWLMAMTTCLGAAIFDAIVDAHEGWYDSELEHLALAVDGKFLRETKAAGFEPAIHGVLSYMERDAMREGHRVIGILRGMAQTGHPFARLYLQGGAWRFMPLVEAARFAAQSDAHREIRVADIAASIFAKGHSAPPKSPMADLYQSCMQLVSSGGPPMKLRLGTGGAGSA